MKQTLFTKQLAEYFNVYLLLNRNFPIFRTIDFCKKVPILNHLQIPTYILTELFLQKSYPFTNKIRYCTKRCLSNRIEKHGIYSPILL